MKLLEYQAKEFFKKYNIPVPKEVLVTKREDIKNAIEDIGVPCVIKAQVGVGGRGKAGGIKKADTKEDAEKKGAEILSMEIKGEKVEKILVSEAVDIEKEYYLGVTIDRAKRSIVFMASPEGGVDIEEVAEKTPEKILKVYINSLLGILPYQLRKLAEFLDPQNYKSFVPVIQQMYQIFVENDCQLVEINPLVRRKNGSIVALDAKIILDDNGLIKHPEFEHYRILKENEKIEHEAKEKGLSYIKLSGNVGCIVNGAGLAMATMDVIKYYGGEPANFLDVGGSSSPEKMKNAMELVTRDPNVKVIFVNIFGGITRCDDIAKGLLEAKNELKLSHPVVVRLTGTNEEMAKEMLKNTELFFAETMAEGAKKAIELAGNGNK